MMAIMAKKKDRHLNPKIGVHMPPDLRTALGRYLDHLEIRPKMSEAVRHVLRKFLEEKGYLDAKDRRGDDDD